MQRSVSLRKVIHESAENILSKEMRDRSSIDCRQASFEGHQADIFGRNRGGFGEEVACYTWKH